MKSQSKKKQRIRFTKIARRELFKTALSKKQASSYAFFLSGIYIDESQGYLDDGKKIIRDSVIDEVWEEIYCWEG